ncbi:hypothetical protein BpHYR1_027553 [Brachionus plicatilis]|uniref:Uncharacterized protein n=1 Tax=Brachionus plicatilis TaxID=10195 RepID=A0A3M7SNN1_BRAPC|nr:hypothetical protein BpHYR1_027553 [Brachionus plicatilis]
MIFRIYHHFQGEIFFVSKPIENFVLNRLHLQPENEVFKQSDHFKKFLSFVSFAKILKTLFLSYKMIWYLDKAYITKFARKSIFKIRKTRGKKIKSNILKNFKKHNYSLIGGDQFLICVINNNYMICYVKT